MTVPGVKTERVDVVVVGAGLAGLTAAWHLRDRRVTVLESSDRIGGRLCSERRGDIWLNYGAHVFGLPTSPAGRLIETLGLDARAAPGRLAAAELRGRIAGSGPVELMPFQLPLSTVDRIALLRAGARLRLAVRRYAALAKGRPGENVDAKQARVLAFMDDQSMSEFLGPLPPDVDGLFRATLTRSSGEPEELQAGYGVGYFHLVWDRTGGLSRNLVGGSSTLAEALGSALPDVRLGARVTAVKDTGSGVAVEYEIQNATYSLEATSAVVAIPAPAVVEIVTGLADQTVEALSQIVYGPYVVGAFRTTEQRPMPWDGIYALATPSRSFSMLFNTTNAVRGLGGRREPGGSLTVYAAADLARALFRERDSEIERRFLDDLFAVFPSARRVVEEVVIKRWELGLPYPRPGRAALQEPLTRPQLRIHLAGDYLGTSYTDTAAWTGEVAARRARATVERRG